MPKQLLDCDVVDMMTTEEILFVINRAKDRGVTVPAIIGALLGCVVSFADESDATPDDIAEITVLCWKTLEEERAQKAI